MKRKLDWTGERLVTSKTGDIVEQHLHRYALAMEYVKGKTVLDIASGEGYGTNLLSRVANETIGVDIDKEAVDFANEKYGKDKLTFLTGSADKIPVKDKSIDVVVSFETIEHHDKHEEMFMEIKRVLKDDGVLIMSSPDKLNYTDIPNFQNPFHVKELYREDFKALVSKYFSSVQIYYQTMYYGSIIVTEDGAGNNFKEYEGNFDDIKSNPSIKVPVYNLCIASEVELNDKKQVSFSMFNAIDLLNTILGKEQEIYNSKTYKLGKLLTFPLRLFRK